MASHRRKIKIDHVNKSLSSLFDLEYEYMEDEPDDDIVIDSNRVPTIVSCKEWIITNINTGDTFKIYNLSQFCRDNNLRDEKMRGVARGTKRTYKGWIVRGGADSNIKRQKEYSEEFVGKRTPEQKAWLSKVMMGRPKPKFLCDITTHIEYGRGNASKHLPELRPYFP